MKTMLIPVIGLVVGILGGTFYGGLKERDVILAEKKAEEVAARTEHDEGTDQHGDPDPVILPEAEAHASETDDVPDEGHIPDEEVAAGDTAHATEDDHAPTTPTDPVEDPPEAMGTQASTEVVSENPGTNEFASQPAATPLEEPEAETGFLSGENGGPERLAKIFGAMKAPDAAKVLQNLSDRECRAILSHLSDRKAAEILGNFEPERAASLSRLVLGSPGGEAR